MAEFPARNVRNRERREAVGEMKRSAIGGQLSVILICVICLVCGPVLRAGAPAPLDPLPLEMPQALPPDINQILPAVYDSGNSALYAENESGGEDSGPSNADQVLGAVYDSSNTALRINCIAGCSGSGGGSTELETNGTVNSSQSLFNLESGTGITLSNAEGTGNVTVSLSGTLPGSQSTETNEFLTGYNASTGAFALAQPSFSNISGTATLSQLPTISFSNLSGAVAATQLAASPANGDCLGYSSSALDWTSCESGGMVYPGAGVPDSTGSAWGTSYTVGTGDNDLVQLNSSAQLPAVSAANLTNFPTLNQSTTGNAATATALAATPTQCTGSEFATGVAANGNANCGTPSGSGTVTASPQYQLAYYSASGTATSVTGTPTVTLNGGNGLDIALGLTGSGTSPNLLVNPTLDTTGNPDVVAINPSVTEVGSGSYLLHLYNSGTSVWSVDFSGDTVGVAAKFSSVTDSGLTSGDCVQASTGGLLTTTSSACGSGGMVYPGAGVPDSTGSAWGTSYTVGTGDNDLVQLTSAGALPAVSAANLIDFPTLNQSTTGSAATATALAATPSQCSSGGFSTGIAASGAANCAQVAFSNLSGTATLSQLPTIPFSNLSGTVAATQLAASPATGDCLGYSSSALDWTSCGSNGMVYPGAGVANSTGSAWGASYTVGTGDNDLVQLNSSGQLPAVSAANLTNFPTLNQSTTGNAATATALAATPAQCSSGEFATGIAANGNANCGTPSGAVSFTDWSQTSGTETVTGNAAASQNAQTLVLAPGESYGSGLTDDIFQVYNVASPTVQPICSQAASSYGCVFAIGANGNVFLTGNELQLGALNQATASAVELPGGTSLAPFVEFQSPALTAPAEPSATAASGGSLAASTVYDIAFTYVNPAGETEVGTSETLPETPSTCTTSGDCEFTGASPAASSPPNATEYRVYAKPSTGSSWALQSTVAIGTGFTFSSYNEYGAAPPSANGTGGAYDTFLSMSGEGGNVLCASSSTPGADCAGGTRIPEISSTTPTTGDCVEWASANSLGDAGTPCGSGSGGSTAWSSLTAPSTSLTLNMGANATAFDSSLTTSLLTLQQSTAATSSVNVASPSLSLGADMWNGSESCADAWSIQNTPGTGTNPWPQFTLSNSSCSSNSADARFIVDGNLEVAAPSGLSTNLILGTVGSTFEFYVSSSGLVYSNGGLRFTSDNDHIQQNAASSDIAGTITVTTSETSASKTFGAGYTDAPACTLTPTSNPGSLTWWVTTSTAAVTASVSAEPSTSITFNYTCIGNPD